MRLPSIIPINEFDPQLALEAGMACDKASYPTGAQARRALDQIRRRSSRRQDEDGASKGKPQRAYRCERCGRYHLTSYPG